MHQNKMDIYFMSKNFFKTVPNHLERFSSEYLLWQYSGLRVRWVGTPNLLPLRGCNLLGGHGFGVWRSIDTGRGLCRWFIWWQGWWWGLKFLLLILLSLTVWSMVRRLQLNAQMQQRLIFLFRMRFELSGILCRQNMLSRFGTLVSGCAFWE